MENELLKLAKQHGTHQVTTPTIDAMSKAWKALETAHDFLFTYHQDIDPNFDREMSEYDSCMTRITRSQRELCTAIDDEMGKMKFSKDMLDIDELVAALKHLLNAPQDPDAVDQAYATLAKVGADKNGGSPLSA